MTTSADTAALLRVGDAFLGDLDGPADADWIRAELTAGATYELTLTARDPDGDGPRTGARDTILEIYNTQRELIASADDRPLVDGVLPPGGFHPQLSFSPSDGGVHYFRVSSFVYSGGDNSGGYRLELAGPPPATETDDGLFPTDDRAFQFDDNVYPSTTPSAVTELTTVSLFGAVMLQWGPRLDTRLREKALIYRAEENDFSDAVLIHTSEPGTWIFTDRVEPGTYYYWARYMTQDGALGPVYPRPGGDQAPIEGFSDDISRLPGLERLDPDPDQPVVREPVTGAAIQIGGAGDDTLTSAGYAYNLLDGKGGNDTLVAGEDGHVVMIGGPGNDTFDIADSGVDGGPVAFIMDFETPNFERGPDRIRLEDGDARDTPLLDFYNRVMEAGLTFDMEWIAKSGQNSTHEAVTLSLPGDKEIVLVESGEFDEGLGALSLEVIDGDLFIVSLG